MRVPAVMSCWGITAIGGREGRRAVELDSRGFDDEEEEDEQMGSRGVVLWDLGSIGSVDRFRT